jgi:hypothetical protein
MPRKFGFWNNSIDVPVKINENPKSLGYPNILRLIPSG